MSDPPLSNTEVRGKGGSLSVHGVTHEFSRGPRSPHLRVLDSIDLDIAEGSFTSIVGSSGCGKSTLLRIMSGLLVPSSGAAMLGDEVIRSPRPEIGMVFQGDAVFPWLTVRRNVDYGLRMARLPRKERESIASEWCEIVGLGNFKNAYPKELSGGMRKRVDLARTLARDPGVLLMDEPFGALDAQTKNQMQEEVLRVWQAYRKTVVFVTHDLDEATFLSDRVIVMSPHPGRIAAQVDISLARPRTDESRVSSAFLENKRRLWEAFHHA